MSFIIFDQGWAPDHVQMTLTLLEDDLIMTEISPTPWPDVVSFADEPLSWSVSFRLELHVKFRGLLYKNATGCLPETTTLEQAIPCA